MDSPGLRHHEDPGLQPERTALSWTRTVLSMAVCALVLLRWAHTYPSVLIILAVVQLALAVAMSLGQRRRYEIFDRGLIDERVQPNLGAVLAVTVAMGLLSITELTLIFIRG